MKIENAKISKLVVPTFQPKKSDEMKIFREKWKNRLTSKEKYTGQKPVKTASINVQRKYTYSFNVNLYNSSSSKKGSCNLS